MRVYLGTSQRSEKLHSKAYILINNVDSHKLLNRYKAGIIGSSNLTPSGLMSNTELNVIITDPKDLQYVERWFDNLWEIGSEDFQQLKVTNAISQAIEESKFEKHLRETFVYVEPVEFFKILIQYLNADYLFENWKESGLLGFQQFDSIRCLRLFKEKNYRGVFLTSSVGLGKSYVACHCAKYFLYDNKKVLVIAPSGLIQNEEQWPRYLKEFDIFGKVDVLAMGLLQKDPFKFEQFNLREYDKHYSLIIVDEAHNYRNTDAYRTRNLKTIIDRNGDSKILFLTATPINTGLEDLVNLVKLFYRPGSNMQFDKLYRDLVDMLSLISYRPYDILTQKEKESISTIQENIEKELFVKSTRETIKTSPEYLEEIRSFSGTDISKIADPDVHEINYTLDEKYKDIVNGIVKFISNLNAANLRILDPEKGARLSGFFKWILYKRFESDISSYYVTLKRIHKKNNLILQAIEKRDPTILLDIKDDENEIEDEIDVKFEFEYREKISEIISKIKSGEGEKHLAVLGDLKEDIKLIEDELKELELFLQSRNPFLFIDDKKLSKLLDEIRKNTSRKLLVFTEYKDTLKAIKEFFGKRFGKDNIEYIDSGTKNKTKIIDRFNKCDKPQILVATDTLSEGYNISGTDVVINFDIPYNPVKLIQRIGRATRLDNPKPIKVLNFRPAEDIDKEIDLWYHVIGCPLCIQ